MVEEKKEKPLFHKTYCGARESPSSTASSRQSYGEPARPRR